jgi:uncharacterized protein YggE
MRKTVYLITVLLILSALFGAYTMSTLAQGDQGSATQAPQRTLNVTGNGKAYLTPDIAYVYIGVHTENKNVAEAVAANTSAAQKVAEALKALKIDPKDIQTSNFSITPQQQYDQNGKLTGILYVVDNTVYVTVRDLSKLGDVLGAAVQAGANSINGVQFDASDKSKALSEARKAAVADAAAQAKELAEAAGVSLGAVQTINVYGSAMPMPLYEAKGVGGAAGVPVSPGQLVISVDVNIIYEIK